MEPWHLWPIYCNNLIQTFGLEAYIMIILYEKTFIKQEKKINTKFQIKSALFHGFLIPFTHWTQILEKKSIVSNHEMNECIIAHFQIYAKIVNKTLPFYIHILATDYYDIKDKEIQHFIIGEMHRNIYLSNPTFVTNINNPKNIVTSTLSYQEIFDMFNNKLGVYRSIIYVLQD